MNPVHYRKFPREAYMLLWYLADLYTIGVTFNKSMLMQYLINCILKKKKPEYKFLYQWLTLFNSITWWQENIRTIGDVEVLITFKMTRVSTQEDDGVTLQRHYEAHVLPSSQYDFHRRTLMMTRLNGLDESEIDSRLFFPFTAHWHNRDVYPSEYAHEIRLLLAGFHDQYSWPKCNPDHPMYRAEGIRYKIRRYIPGQKRYVTELVSDSDEDEEDE